MKEFNKTGLYLFKVKFDLEDDEDYLEFIKIYHGQCGIPGDDRR